MPLMREEETSNVNSQSAASQPSASHHSTNQSSGVNSLIRNRGTVKGQLRRIETYVKACVRNTCVKADIYIRLERADALLIQFNNVQFEIEEMKLEDEDVSARERDAFETLYYDISARCKELLNGTINTNMPERTASGASLASHETSTSSSVKLPVIDLPTFDGNYERWVPFFDAFLALIDGNDSLADIQKFYYLRSCIKGSALQVIESLPISASNYKLAWELLTKRYENKRLIVHRHVQSLFDYSSLHKESYNQLRELIDSLQKHVRALNNLGQPTEHWDTLLIHLFVSKLDSSTKREWESRVDSSEMPTLKGFIEFLTKHCSVLETLYSNKAKGTQDATKVGSKRFHDRSLAFVASDKSGKACPMCKDDHGMYKCEAFIKLPVQERLQQVRKLKLCFNCLNAGHSVDKCMFGGCKRCAKKHNTLLHADQTAKETVKANESDQASLTCYSANVSSDVLLSTAIIFVLDSRGVAHECCALLDSASQSNFITASFCEKLKLNKRNANVSVAGITQDSTRIISRTKAVIRSRIGEFQTEISFLVIAKIANQLPSRLLSAVSIDIPSELNLADPKFYEPKRVDVLLGATIFWDLLRAGHIRLGNGLPSMHNTTLGWVLSGMIPSNQRRDSSRSICCYNINQDVQQQLERFWRIEECPNKLHRSKEEEACETHFLDTHRRDREGRFIVKLPFRDSPRNLGKSREIALRRFLCLERKLQCRPELRESYASFISEYLALGHMMEVSEPPNRQPPLCYYLPHHAVVKESSSSTRTRVVFDASCRTENGVSLNDILQVGPAIQHDLLTIILRFRQHRYVMTADINKMYRQVLLHTEHRDFQRILWRDYPSEPIKEFRLSTVTYGLASSSFQAIRCLHQVAYENELQYAHASRVIREDFYVDDLLTGCDDIQQLRQLRCDIDHILRQGKFELRKWRANEPSCLHGVQSIAEDDLLSISQEVKTLGVGWKPCVDELQYDINVPVTPREVTKRSILSVISSIFDPLGLLSPIVIRAKIMLQRLWQEALGWDDELPSHLRDAWTEYQARLADSPRINTPRWIISETPRVIELHGFCDASEAAYGACLYAKSIGANGGCKISLVCAKSRVAPLKNLSLPRLELCGALLLSHLLQTVKSAITVKIDQVYCWCDSMITLAWIAAQPCQWTTFVANRVAEIHRCTEGAQWRYVPSNENPADIVSRGTDPATLKDLGLWWEGPPWLKHDEQAWPACAVTKCEIPEARKRNVTFCTLNVTDGIFDRFSNFVKLRRVVAWIRRFKNNALRSDIRCGQLSASELQEATSTLIKAMQQEEFPREIYCLKKSQEVHPKSKLCDLRPFLDKEGIIRVGGRLRYASISFNQKHPIVLPYKHKLTELLIIYYHKLYLHLGPQALLASLRQQYWPLCGRQAIRRVLRKCVTCFRVNPISMTQLMGDLPECRVTPSRPFLHVGTDYAGPFKIKISRNKTDKAYVCIFVCLASKAIHIELVSNLSTAAFLNALKRFIARRGKCMTIYSDNATHFHGANNELRELYKLISDKRKNIHGFLAERVIQWKFIPPRSPHRGGIWEAAVKSVKNHLKKVLGIALLTSEELVTVLCQIESCLNSRPLAPLSNYPSDLHALTPGHFLIGEPLITLPDRDVSDIPLNRLNRYEYLQRLKENFWQRWSREYLCDLQRRSKWARVNRDNLEIGTMIIIKEDNTPPMCWKLGTVTALYPGGDGIVRTVGIKTSSGECKRSVNKICILPIGTEHDK